MNETSAWLNLIGNSLEFVGAAILVYEIVKDAREAKRYITRPVTLRIDSVRHQMRLGTPTLQTDPPPSVEQRLDSLERRATDLQESLEDAKENLRREWGADLSSLQERLTGHVNDWNRALETLTLGVATGSLRLRILGVVLVLLGIALGIASAVVPI